MTSKFLKILYSVFVVLSSTLCIYFIWLNAKAVIDIATGKDNLLTQITTMSDTQAMFYSTAYLILLLTLLFLEIRLFVKAKNKQTIIVSILIWVLTLIELFTDTLLHISV
jgi:hypothetical protein